MIGIGHGEIPMRFVIIGPKIATGMPRQPHPAASFNCSDIGASLPPLTSFSATASVPLGSHDNRLASGGNPARTRQAALHGSRRALPTV